MNEHNVQTDMELPQPKGKNLWHRMRSWLSRTWRRLLPGPQVQKGAAIALSVLVVFCAVLSGLYIRPGLPGILDTLGGTLIFLFFAGLLGLLFAFLLKILFFLPRFLTFMGVVALGLFLFFMKNFGFPNALLVGLAIAFTWALFGGALARFFTKAFGKASLIKKIYILAVLLMTAALNVYLVYWFVNRGSDGHLVDVKYENAGIEPLNMPDPSQPGPYDVIYLTYGSGTDKRRPAFGKNAEILTEPVDATPFLKGSKGWKLKLREWFWGFDFEKFPRNGRVWYPQGQGPFPLVLCVHGNHNMAEYSDPGYAYLGELLASRGFIFVSVDENFFNGHLFSGIKTENDGRGWMLLQHLKLWRAWNQKEANPFYGNVDMDNLGLIGHSRGGEAAAIAGFFNRLSHYPDDATVEFDFGFNIKAIIAIAPSDGQYKPAGQPTPLENVNYMTLQGAHDADVSSFSGARQYNRVRFTDNQYWFKTYIYTYRSNHGQFNTVWGDMDWGKPWGKILNRKALLSGEDQRKIGSIYISAFLECALKGNKRYLPLFRDFRCILNWLPEDAYINRFEDSTFRAVADFDEDVDVTTASQKGSVIRAKNLAVWREADLGFRRRGTKNNNVVYVGWRKPEPDKADSGEPMEERPPSHDEKNQDQGSEEPASYSIGIPEGIPAEIRLSSDSVLVFSLADADERPPQPEGEDKQEVKNEGKKEEKNKKSLDFCVEIGMIDGQTAKVPLSRFRAVPPVLKSRFTKYGKESKLYGKAYEPTLQVVEIPLAAFREELTDFDPLNLKTIRFVFDRCPEGVIIFDRIGFARPHSSSDEEK
jgi:hypothetical protein